MKGWKTLAYALAVAIVGVLQVTDWAAIIPQGKAWTGGVMIAIACGVAALRSITTTPVGKQQ